jgi:preprotein translocase subunit SecE
MALAKAKERDSGSGEPQHKNRLVRTFREVRSEMRKVVWPTREETIRLTVVVIVLSAALSIVLGLADFIYTTLLSLLQNAVR